MSKHEMPFRYDVHWGYIEKNLKLDPMDYIEYDDIDDIRAAIYDEIWDTINTGDLDVDQSELNYELPDEFIDEWEELKGYK